MFNISFPEEEFDLFIDVGLSHNAPHTRETLSTNPKAFVIGIEPNPESCQSIRRLNLGDRFHLIEGGASDILETIILNMMSPDPGTSSFLSVTNILLDQGYSIINKVEVPCFRLESILDEVPWQRVNGGSFSMKSDTQGYEVKVLLGLGPYLDKIKDLQIESTTWGQYENAATLDDIKMIIDPHLEFIKEDRENAWFKKKS